MPHKESTATTTTTNTVPSTTSTSEVDGHVDPNQGDDNNNNNSNCNDDDGDDTTNQKQQQHHLIEATKRLQNVSVIPINCNFDIVTEQSANTALPVPKMTKVELKRCKGNVTIVFAVRSPGCAACREHGIQLKEFVAASKQSDIALVGVVKETGPNVNRNLLEFYQNYFRFPLYKDDKWGIYKALGNRKLSFFTGLWRIRKLTKRVSTKNISWGVPNGGGDDYTLGGVLIFDKKGSLRYTYPEQFGMELDMNKIQKAIDDARNISSSSSS